ncbi:hypothetical protein SDRG_07188 [Saprolegnia diclina VS20]|uniref:RWP-RK domain-containing protein n=1 Tax=Saprolegnia diclina (strain VS20) TaxID=1156394 RepID=T0QNT8_SAPDV|nr:hypothetical protein SDRG_07188 [Saprolegnia diclina VS20]EQC35480.1 hypothetical protein SDRG_07188 [Saprolegnia diclina VS20]|eukprot:XP_008611230.1 hypothetical protein SDRG_07188 [Saprolegnia diclina VS20]
MANEATSLRMHGDASAAVMGRPLRPPLMLDPNFVLRPLRTSDRVEMPPWRPREQLAEPLPRFQTILPSENDRQRANPAPPSLVQEAQAQHRLWKEREHELMRRQRHALGLKEKELGRSRRCAAPHRLQELFMRRQHELMQQQEQQKRIERNVYQLTYHRMLAEEDLQRLQHQERLQQQAKAQQLESSKVQTFERAVLQAPSLDAVSTRRVSASTVNDADGASLLSFLLPPALPPPQNGWNVKGVTLNELRPHFNKPMAVVAQEMGVCITLMKKICRKNGLSRWPHRRIRSLVNRITSLQAVADTVVEKVEKARFVAHIASLRRELSDVIHNPNGKSRKAQEYERRKDISAGDSMSDDTTLSDDGGKPLDMDLSCFEVLRDEKARGSISSLLCD